MVRAILRLVLALGGGAAAAVLVAVLESRLVAAGVVEAGAPALPLTILVPSELGILAPLALFVSGAIGVAAIILDPREPASPVDRLQELRSAPLVDRLRTASAAPLVVFATFAWCVASAHAGKTILAVGKPAEAGLSLAVASLTLFFVAFACAAALVPTVRRALAASSASAPQLLDPAVTGGIALVVVILLFAMGVAFGDTSGEGSVVAIFGVFRREGLDLRPLANLALLALGAYGAPLALARGRLSDPDGALRPRPILGATAACGLLVFLTGLMAWSSRALNSDPAVAFGIQKYAPIGKVSLAILRKATDHDKDGYSAYFGGGDCNDGDPNVNPNAVDVPGNGIDEDCSGADTIPPVAVPIVVVPKPQQRAHKSFNVILFTVDTLRADVGFNGYPKPVTPNLDKLAEKGTVFERAYSMASYTGKSVGPFLIGRYPSETHTDFSHFNTYYNDNVFVTERLHDVGYRTFGASCHFYFKGANGLSQGMDQWDISALPVGLTDNDTSITGEKMGDAALKLLSDPANTAAVDDEGNAKRFFAWFHFFDPHMAYVPHPGAPDFLGESKSPAAVNRALYDGEIWFTDKHIGRVLDYVASQPWGKETAIILTADHGEAFAEHNMLWHGSELWEELVRVPLLVYVPGAEPRRVSLKRSHIDLAPTIADLGGAKVEPGSMRGVSLLDDILAPEGADLEERDVFIDMPAGPFNPLKRALISGPSPGKKLIHAGGGNYQLFDLEADPKEKKDLANDRSELRPMIEKLQAIRAKLEDRAAKE